ncbi:MAG: hypothetical protein ACKV22_32650 [Bryobacteraceae bacterium]
MTILLRILPLFLLYAAVPVFRAGDAPDGREQKEIARALEELREVSGLRAKKPLRHEMIRRDQVGVFLKKRVKESVDPEQIRAEEITLKKFGLVPPDFNLEKSTVDLLTEQAAAFYDYKKRKLYLMEGSPADLSEMALVHEVSHALADQNFNLARFIKNAGPSDDSALARIAVMEGQASWLAGEVLARRRGQSLVTNKPLFEMLSGANEVSTAGFPILQSVPLYLRETLMFPYTRGLRFQHALYEKDKQSAFARVFTSPPVTTQQILHPEKYFEQAGPTRPELPELPRRRGYKTIAEGMVGELDHTILLQEYVSRETALEVAPHWTGGRYRLLERKPRTVLSYAVSWDSPEIASRYFGLYRKILEKKWKRFQVARETPGLLEGEGDDGHFETRLEGSVVSSIEGMGAPNP